jgi:hypothetical protein
VSRRRTIYLVVAILAVLGGAIVGRHLTAASAIDAAAPTTTVAHAEARATLLLGRAAVGQLDKQGEAELRGLIRKYHLIPTGPAQCRAPTKTTDTTTLSCVAKNGVVAANSNRLWLGFTQAPSDN